MNVLKNKKGQTAALLTMLLTSIGIGTVVGSYSSWLLSLKNNEHEVSRALIGQILSMNKWDEIIHQSPKEKTLNTNKTDVSVDDDGNKTTVTYGKRGIYRNGKCDVSGTENEMKSAYQTCTDINIKVTDKENKPLYEFNSVSLLSTTYAYPVGTIIPYTGDLTKVPEDWALCDGNNGTPNLNNTFLKATDQQSEVGKTGGNNTFVLKQANLPSATFDISSPTQMVLGTYRYPLSSGTIVRFCDANTNLSLRMHNLSTYIHIPDWKSVPFPVAPKHQTTAYIMKIK